MSEMFKEWNNYYIGGYAYVAIEVWVHTISRYNNANNQ